MPTGVPPHGGRLVRRLVSEDRREPARAEAEELPRLSVAPSILLDAYNVAHGAYSPLTGFQGREAVESVVREGRLPDGLAWTLPVVCPVPEGAPHVLEDERVALVAPDGSVPATLDVEETFTLHARWMARGVYGTDDPRHPGVQRVLATGNRFLAGPVTLLDAHRLNGASTPSETRALIRERGWRTVCGYQTRNPPHRAHEFLHKVVLSLVDGLLIHPVVGPKRTGDFRDDVVSDAYHALLSNYYPRDRVAFSLLPYAMRYAGPREAVFHAILRKNHGCTHFVVGRDHAGPGGGYYAPDAAMRIFDAYPDLGVTPVSVAGDHFWCRACGSVESERTCAHGEAGRLHFSGTRIRQTLRQGQAPPPEVMRPEVVGVMLKHDRLFVEGEEDHTWPRK